ncbi:MAG: SGNH/GDSL hydrolase family protein [Acidobacteria bacterium]|nr:SGNH/GDSL hydrolase family protein [Acidobacteriota bacterium]
MPGTPHRRSYWFVVLVAALTTGACSGNGGGGPTQPSPPPTTGPIYYTAIGASDAVGVGASVPCFPFAPCPDGTGYVPVVARRLAASREVNTTNLGLPATVIGPEIQALGNRHGRGIPGNFIQNAMPFVPRNSTLVTIFAGGNDVNAVGAALEGGAGGTAPEAFIAQQVRVFADHYDELLRGIRQRAPSAQIVVLNVPNFAGLPFTAGYTPLRRRGLERISVGFSTEVVNRLTSHDVRVVDLLCDARSYQAANYSSDGFHPNDAGYAFMADLLVAAIERGAPSPRSTCPEMTLAPQ